MRQIVLFFFLLFFFYNSFSQTPDWSWAKAAGKYFQASGRLATTDVFGNIYVAGIFNDDTIMFGSHTLVNFNFGPGYADGFLVKYDTAGNAIWARKFGGYFEDYPLGIAADIFGNIYVVGEYSGAYMVAETDTLVNASMNPAISDAFVLKYDNAGNLLWTKRWGNQSYDAISAVATDPLTGNVYLGGYYQGTLVFGSDSITSSIPSNNSIFLAALDTSGNSLWVRQGTGPQNNIPKSLAVDGSGNVYMSGIFDGDSINFGASTLFLQGFTNTFDIFLIKYSSSGNLIWLTGGGGTVNDYVTSIALDAASNIYLTGRTTNCTFGLVTLASVGGYDGFLVKFNSAGNVLWGRTAEGATDDFSFSVTTDNFGNAYTAGYYRSPTLTISSMVLTNSGPAYFADFYVTKYDSSGNALWVQTGIGTDHDRAHSITLDAWGNLYVTGDFECTSFILGSDTLVNPVLQSRMFVAKLNSSSGNCAAYYTLQADTAPHTYWATNYATGVSPIQYLWSWGDTGYDTIPYPSHTYAAAGFYTICLAIQDNTGCTNTYCYNYSLARMDMSNKMLYVNVVPPSFPTEIPDILSEKLTVFPNPINTEIILTLDSDEYFRIQLYNTVGELMFESVNNFRKAKIDATKFSSGVYFITVIDSETNSVTRKIVKM